MPNDQEQVNQLMKMIQEIKETVIQMNSSMQYAQKGQNELKNQVDIINKKNEDFNTKLLEMQNQQNNMDSRIAKTEKWWNIITTTVFGAISAAILALIIK